MTCTGSMEVRADTDDYGTVVSVECTGCDYTAHAEGSVLSLTGVLAYKADHDREHHLRDVTRIRHKRVPEPSGCRWCGASERGHGSCFVKSVGLHTYVPPTKAQRKARIFARARGL